jgi:peptide/nickel transport system permease protein
MSMDAPLGSTFVTGSADVTAVVQRRRSRLRSLPWLWLALVAAMVLAAIFVPVFSPYGLDEQDLSHRLTPPAWQAGGTSAHLFGTDALGRDYMTRLFAAGRISLLMGVVVVTAAATLGAVIGLVAGFLGGAMDSLLMRATDVQLGMPVLLFAVAVAAALGPGVKNIILILSFWSWAPFARVVRSETLSLRETDFVTAARVIGCRNFRIIFRHLAPHVANTVTVLSTLVVGQIIIAEASLSFLGLGVQPPTPAWGSMLSESRTYVSIAWWLVVLPGCMIIAIVLSANMIGEWLRDFLDPYKRGLD